MKVLRGKCMCNVSVVQKKTAVGLAGQEVHTSGWINFVCI
jgi:hypothetical protein